MITRRVFVGSLAGGLLAAPLAAAGRAISTLPVPLDSACRGKAAILGYPALGENNDLIEQRGAA